MGLHGSVWEVQQQLFYSREAENLGVAESMKLDGWKAPNWAWGTGEPLQSCCSAVPNLKPRELSSDQWRNAAAEAATNGVELVDETQKQKKSKKQVYPLYCFSRILLEDAAHI